MIILSCVDLLLDAKSRLDILLIDFCLLLVSEDVDDDWLCLLLLFELGVVVSITSSPRCFLDRDVLALILAVVALTAGLTDSLPF